MRQKKFGKRWVYCVGILSLGAAVTGLFDPAAEPPGMPESRDPAIGSPRLVSVEPLPAATEAMCPWEPSGERLRTVAAVQEERLSRAPGGAANLAPPTDRAPLRVIRDPYPTYSAVAVDPLRDEIVLQDENLYQIMVYDRTANTPPTATMTEPKRRIGGPSTKVEFNCGLYIDPDSGDVYSINNDTVNTMVVFSRQARGNVAPDRELRTPHRTFGIAVHEEDKELFLTVQYPPAVVVYPKVAKGNDAPLRILEGDRTQLKDPHGIAVDPKNRLIFVSNHGAYSRSEEGRNFLRNFLLEGGKPPLHWTIPNEVATRKYILPGSGKYDPPSITVYPLQASGNVAPLRVIEGPRTQLNWPTQIGVDPERGDLFVANDVDDSILVFRATDQGNAAPSRVIRGPKTGIKNPTGVYVDAKNREVVVANMGNHSATVYPLAADGDVPPLRTIRAAPAAKQALTIGNPGALAYDTKRDEILVPN